MSIEQVQIVSDRLRQIDVLLRTMRNMHQAIREGNKIVLATLVCRDRNEMDDNEEYQLQNANIGWMEAYDPQSLVDFKPIEYPELEHHSTPLIELPLGSGEFILEEAIKDYEAKKKKLVKRLSVLSNRILREQVKKNTPN